MTYQEINMIVDSLEVDENGEVFILDIINDIWYNDNE